VSYRLLAVCAGAQDEAELCPSTLAHYARRGVECWVEVPRGTGREGELEARCAELYRRFAPHVVITVSPDPIERDRGKMALHRAASRAFRTQRMGMAGSSARPLKLYFRVPANSGGTVQATTVIDGPHGRELFTRSYPAPWVTGVIERDLFSGIQLAAGDGGLDLLAG
jgi:LmbE family N-acetylglucosaminyl deacetylase